MKVIVASCSKCGTKTLHKCLEILGYEVHDFDSYVMVHEKEWMHILKYGSSNELFKRMYTDVDAICDIPGCFYWEEIHKAFPEAKIILTMRRNEEEWYKSFNNQIRISNEMTRLRVCMAITPTGRRLLAFWRRVGSALFSCPTQPFLKWLQNSNAQLMKRRYREHNDSVLKKAPKDKLLRMDLSDGWEPLCQFLGKDIPKEEFPHKNIGGSIVNSFSEIPIFAKMFNELYVIRIFFIIAIVAIIIIAIYTS